MKEIRLYVALTTYSPPVQLLRYTWLSRDAQSGDIDLTIEPVIYTETVRKSTPQSTNWRGFGSLLTFASDSGLIVKAGMERLAGRITLLSGWRRAVLATVAGAVTVLSQAPYDFFAICFVSFPVLIWLLDGVTSEPRSGLRGRLLPAFSVGWFFGFGYFVAGLWWIGAALLVEAEAHAWALPLAVIALPAALAVFHGLACALARIFWADDLGRLFVLAAAFGLAEWARAILFTGFPWNSIGYAAMPFPLLMQSASVLGLYAVNALAVLVFALPALLAGRNYRVMGFSIALILLAVHASFGWWRLANDDLKPVPNPLSARLVQPSIDQARKWDEAEQARIFETYLKLSALPPEAGNAPPELIIWPETSIPYLITQHPEVLSAIGDMLTEGQTLLAGAVRSEGDQTGGEARYYNAIVMINSDGEILDAADKLHLVPFGEYVPFASLLGFVGIDKLVNAPASFTAAQTRRLLTLPSGQTVLPFICYEIIFPHETNLFAGKVDAMVNVTNDAWYGNTPGPYQHFRQAQLRAVEMGVPLLRAANNGISAAVDAKGRIIDGFGLNAVGNLDVTLMTGTASVTTAQFKRNLALGVHLALALLGCGMSIVVRQGAT